MRLIGKYYLSVLNFSLFLCAANVDGLCQQTQHSLDVPAHHYQGFGQDSAAASIAQSAHVIIGFVAVRPKQWSAYDFQFAGGTFSDLLDLYHAEFPGYEWKQVDDGIFRIVRKEHEVSLADQIIYFDGTTEQIRQILWKKVWALPQVTLWMREHHCSPLEIENSFESKRHDQTISLKPGVLTVSELLDEIAMKSGSSYWSMTQSFHPCTISINVD